MIDNKKIIGQFKRERHINKNDEEVIVYGNDVNDDTYYNGIPTIICPTCDTNIIDEFMKKSLEYDRQKYNEEKNKNSDDNDVKVTNYDKDNVDLTIRVNDTSLSNNSTIRNVNFKKVFENGCYDNDLSINDIDLTCINRYSKVRSKTVAGAPGVNAFLSCLGVGDAIQIPLYHSGFWVTIRPPKQLDIIALERRIANEEVEIRRSTSALFYSNYGAMANKLLIEFAIKHVTNPTLKLENGDKLIDYISINDYPILVLGLISTMFPRGVNFIHSCKNTMKMNENLEPLCNFKPEFKIEPKKMLFVNKDALPESCLHSLTNKKSDSVTVDDVKKYQAEINKYLSKEISLDLDNGSKLNLGIKVPSLSRYIDYSNKWVDSIIEKSKAIFKGKESKEEKDEIINNLVKSIQFGLYNSFIDKLSITNDDGFADVFDKSITENNKIETTDINTINDILEELSIHEFIVDKFGEEFDNFIAESFIAVVGIPAFECPECKEMNTSEDNKANKLSDIIVVNLVNSFFGLAGLRGQKTVVTKSEMMKLHDL